MKKAVMLVCLVLSGMALFALDVIDVVQTADGSIYKGVIIENLVNQYIRIEIAGGSIIKLPYGQVTVITREKPPAAAVAATPAAPQASAPEADDRRLVESIQDRLYGLSISELGDIDPAAIGVTKLSGDGRRQVFRDLERTDATGPFVLNLLLGFGIGSLVQGDGAAGWYGLLSGLGYVGSGVYWIYTSMSGYSYGSYGYGRTSDYVTGALVFGALGLNYAIAYVVGLVSPFSYQDNYNRALRETLQY